MQTILLVTGNAGKLREWQHLMTKEITLESVDLDLTEIQSDDPIEIVTDKAKRAFQTVGKPVVVEDVSVELDCLNGLPGPFVKFFLKRLGADALYRLASNREGQKATAACVVCYYDGTNLFTVRGDVAGTIVAPRGENGFGFDSTFVPAGHSLTFAEMPANEKNSLSHRQKAISLFVEKLRQPDSTA